jgi:anti-anti-sigma regulatory factor
MKFDGGLTVVHAAEIRKALLKALKAADGVVIDAGNVTNVDISGLQLLCSAHRMAAESGKRISYTGKLPGAFQKAAEEAGYERPAGCRFACEKNCFWMSR